MVLNLLVVDTHRHTGNLITLLSFLESKLKIGGGGVKSSTKFEKLFLKIEFTLSLILIYITNLTDCNIFFT
jgi:hypothetical protein